MIYKKKKDVILFNKEKIGWTFIDVNSFLNFLNNNRVYYIGLKGYISLENENIKEFEIGTRYKSISLYHVSIYNICNELKIFKDELRLDKHRATINKWFYVAVKTIDYLEQVFVNNNVIGSIIFHGHLLFDACLLEISKRNNVKILTLENTANRNRIVWDSISGYVVNYNSAKNYYYKYLNFISEKLVESYCQSIKSNFKNIKRDEHLSNFKNNNIPFKDSYILFLCQVYNDASQLFTLEDDFKNPVKVIFALVNALKDSNQKLIIKIHPKEILLEDPVVGKKYNEITYKRIKNLIGDNVFIDRYNEYDTYRLIENSKAVVTVNSQAGLESCICNKPVLAYYKSFYSGMGFTYDYSNSCDLEFKINYLLKNNLTTNKNVVMANIFFYVFFEKYCIDKNPQALFNKVVETFNIKKRINFKSFLKLKVNKVIKKVILKIKTILSII